MEIQKTSTPDGYEVVVLCPRPRCHWEGRVDPQAPLWAVFVKVEEHHVQSHSLRREIEDMRVMSKTGKHRVETLELPDE